ncbi:MAG: 3-methylornithine--L-lysine ligase PylC [Candidatus Adiutrix sp.]|jgi:pyrrolysine biosynthesis protein PylC|nr:3-methylornithine--L-lysine ligase PylC [Candidatus Adiutrix sp.]
MTFRLGILGGGLQGTEAACLARWAGWETVLVDARPQAPASALAGRFLHLPVAGFGDLEKAFGHCDAVVPACEDLPTLELLSRWGDESGLPVAFDLEAYRISRDKILSKALFLKAGIPAPLAWPEAGYPLIAKPAASSGSRGVTLLATEADFRRKFPSGDISGWVVEEYCPGPSYSLEATGRPGAHRAWLTTALEMDEVYDCRLVRAPAALPGRQEEELRSFSLKTAAALGLTGLMDVEVIAAPQGLRVLEIDARLPSQTPTAVLWSSGENLLARLTEIFCPCPRPEPAVSGRAVIYEHAAVTPAGLKSAGEHLMSAAGPLSLKENFFGADLAVTDYAPGRAAWAAALIMTGEDADAAQARRREVWARLARRFSRQRTIQ